MVQNCHLVNHTVYRILTDRSVVCVFVLESGEEVVGVYVADRPITDNNRSTEYNLIRMNEAYRRARSHAEDILEQKRLYDDVVDAEGVMRYAD